METTSNKQQPITKSKKDKLHSIWDKKRRIKKLNDFKLTKDEKFLLKSTDEELRTFVINEINDNLKRISNEIEKANNVISSSTNKDEVLTNRKHKKYLLIKLKKLKKTLNDESGINARIKVFKLRRNKLKSTKKKVEKSLGELKTSMKRCLKCKKRGHIAENCPLNKGEGSDDDDEDDNEENENNKTVHKDKICYNCGSTEHGLYQCDKPVDYNNLPFAECYKCKGKGHISANCPNNVNGIYIRGGACYVCGKKDHLAKNCPEKQNKEEVFDTHKNKKKKKENQ
jgi:zinc finger CCHC domain-containing protein 9